MRTVMRYVSLSLVAGTILAVAACGGKPSAKQAEPDTATGTRRVEARISIDEADVYVAPFLPGKGLPVAFCGEQIHDLYEAGIYSRELGVPFEGQDASAPSGAESIKPLPPNVAMWRDGTVIWSAIPDCEDVKHYEGRVHPDAVQRLVESIHGGNYDGHDNMKFSQQVLDSDIPESSLIAVLDIPESFVLRCQIDQMKRIKEYWYPESTQKLIRFPFDAYSFDKFSDEVPESYSQYLLDWLRLRDRLRAIIPEKGNVVDLDKRLLWVVLADKRLDPSRLNGTGEDGPRE